ncbi:MULTISPECIES: hypothetical protein [Helicobacter]|uniref:Lipoprotein n=2 Tax=Helicobacter typhlonius TaxID=76936 RepID=A0A099UEH3_9HELI|nr:MULTISPECIES: hypothetical protein [Helicobacter]TLD77902.1 hypothetical protein LS75_008990 [Helicobacter typhlonius]TLD87408.1 hypothetical protein LS67_006835 [Helicobacter sp. MIT 03-1616]CUU40206.1 Hypothetical protein BN2458_PEG1321 [Helicobacter typhlonius]HCD72715.1 hypothetical protein [Helicobacter sp.]
MKKLIFVLGLGLVLVACGNKDDAAKDESPAPVEVIEEVEVVVPVEEAKDDKAEVTEEVGKATTESTEEAKDEEASKEETAQ